MRSRGGEVLAQPEAQSPSRTLVREVLGSFGAGGTVEWGAGLDDQPGESFGAA